MLRAQTGHDLRHVVTATGMVCDEKPEIRGQVVDRINRVSVSEARPRA